MNYLIVGGSSGIGLELVRRLAAEGHVVFSASRHKGEIPDVAHHIHVDVLEDVSSLHEQLPDVLDGLAYCPGTINLKPFTRLKEEDFLNDYKLNVIGAVKIIQFLIENLKAAETSSVVLFSSVAVKAGMGYHSSVASAKGAIEGLTKSLAAEFAVNRIRVNAIAPSLTETSLAHQLLSTPEKKQAADKRHPLGRIGTAKELAEAAFFLLSFQSSWITGQIIAIDGGISSIKNI